MEIEKFTFSEIHPLYGGEIYFEIKDTVIRIHDRFIYSTLTDLIRAIIDLWKDKKQLIQIRLEEETSWYDLLLIRYPESILKIEIYHEVLWNFFDYPKYIIPDPIYVGLTDHHSFSFLITQELERQGLSIFRDKRYPYPAKEIELLRKLMVGDF